MNLEHVLWSTRGKSWGFRFLLVPQQLCDANWQLVRDEIFRSSMDDAEFFARGKRDLNHGSCASFVAGRFLDPEARRDAAGRMIPHEIILVETAGHMPDVHTAAELRECVWPLLQEAYGHLYGLEAGDAGGLEIVVTNSGLVIQPVQSKRPLPSQGQPPRLPNQARLLILLALAVGTGIGLAMSRFTRTRTGDGIPPDDSRSRIGEVLSDLESLDDYFRKNPDAVTAVERALGKAPGTITREELTAALIHSRVAESRNGQPSRRTSDATTRPKRP